MARPLRVKLRLGERLDSGGKEDHSRSRKGAPIKVVSVLLFLTVLKRHRAGAGVAVLSRKAALMGSIDSDSYRDRQRCRLLRFSCEFKTDSAPTAEMSTRLFHNDQLMVPADAQRYEPS